MRQPTNLVNSFWDTVFSDGSRTQSFLADPTPTCLLCNDQDDEVAFPTQHTIYHPPEDEEEEETLRQLMTIHRNLGHPSNKQLQQILRDAQAPPATVTLAGNYIARCVNVFSD